MILPSYYEFFNPVKIIAGQKALENIPHEIRLLGASRPLVITDAGIEKAGLLKLVLAAFSDSGMHIAAVFTDTPVDSSVATVNELAVLYKQEACDAIIAVGGGSVIDTAKGVNMVTTLGTDDLMRFAGADRLKQALGPLLIVPTTAGTGSEVTNVAVISDPAKGMKLPFTSQFLLPQVAVLDPRMTLGLPAKLTAATAMDALTHAIEAYTSLQKNPMSDAYATAAISLIRDNLYAAVQDGSDTAKRFALANAALMAGASFSNAMVGAVHALGHAAGAVAHVPHGVAMAVLLPWVMEFNFDILKSCYAELFLHLAGEELFVRTPENLRAEKLIAKVREMNEVLHRLCGHPRSLSEAGVETSQLRAIARTCLDDGALITNRKEVDYDDAWEILKKAM